MISLEEHGRVAMIVLDRPPANALDLGMVEGLESALDGIDAGEAAAIVIRSTGSRVFCAGADIGLIEKCLRSTEGLHEMLTFIRRLRGVLARIESHPVPSIAALDGSTTGGGLELALACDLRVVGDDIRLGLPEARIGLLPGAGGTQRLTALAGRGVANRVILGAELIDGAEAVRVGIAERCVPTAGVRDAALAWAEEIAALPRGATVWNKRAIAQARSESGFDTELAATAELLADEGTAELVSRFLSSRRTGEGRS